MQDQDADALIARLWLSLGGEIGAAKDLQTLAAVLRDHFERFDVSRTRAPCRCDRSSMPLPPGA